LWLIQRTYRRYFYTTWKGNPSSQMWFFVELCSSWQDFNWLKASRGPSAIAELLVDLAKAISRKRCKIGGKLVLITNRNLGSRIWAFHLCQHRWPWINLNDVMAVILRYFTEFVYDYIVVKQLLGLPRFQNLLLMVYDHINTNCAIIQQLFGHNKLW